MMTNRLHSLNRTFLIEWLIILLVIVLYSRTGLLDFDDQQLQQTGEHNESATLPILAEIGLQRYGEIPLWNPYMLTGFPLAGDLINHFWNPIATVPVMIWGGVNGMKVSVFLTLLAAAFGQWFLAHVFGLRGIFRLWAGLLFALSGGVAGLWFLGWYELLVGVAWFPWCFALLWRALHRRDHLSVILAAVAVAMVLTTGGGYYPLYLALSLGALTLAALFWHKPAERGPQLRRAAAVAILAVGLAAVYLVPVIDGWRFTARDTPPDMSQYNAQPVAYALFNYVVSDKTWFRADALNKTSGSGWYFIGVLPILALALTPWLFARASWRRRGILTLLFLLLALLLWHANRSYPVRALYDWFPFLYTFRFPNRLLIVIASPLIVLAAVNLQGLLVWSRRAWHGMRLGILSRNARGAGGLSLLTLFNLFVVGLLVMSTANVYRVNKEFANAPHSRNFQARDVLTWLKNEDPGLYYIDIGGDRPYWDWMAYAYELEMPVLNFRYNRRLRSLDHQIAENSPFKAQPRYVILGQDRPAPENAELLAPISGVIVWRRTDALPYGFVTGGGDAAMTPDSVRETAVRLDGPNRIIAAASADGEGERLVILASDYPGWQLRVDGEPATIRPVNGYLGAELLPGEHTYVFEFRPPLHALGLIISLTTGLACLWLVGYEQLRREKSRAAQMRPSIDPAYPVNSM